ncbi:hypothetical protein L249_3147 [Ophiocordyceps polyrhachis-furcata BCC 54312]|uniref:Copper acquisition factor BIM1-like domain-containing protein n=1 Tax=Ophiocordyceps polyrhachis-furcata BCC 54312 TaxID=1330021 RepID=A0A367LPB8_9HYPO|nr:hypothetical protein L249_3147 [Ophiocordyceps polyrhachis-furcata BCC 54312]
MRYSIETSLALGLALMATAVTAGHHDRKKSPLNPSTSPVTDDNMGPASMLWPQSRVWTSDMDNTAPCGSSGAIAIRTKFPMKGGKVSLVAQDDYYDTQISISYNKGMHIFLSSSVSFEYHTYNNNNNNAKDPKDNSDFTPLNMAKSTMNDLDPGHTCVDVPDAPTDLVSPGTNATIQVIYRSNWDKPENQTFYVCSDITYVLAENFDDDMLCFNATVPGEDNINPPWIKKVDKKPFGGGPNEGAVNPPAVTSDGRSLLSGGDIAGIVIGSLAAVAMVAGLVILLVRRSQQKKRRNQHIARMENARQDQGPMEKHSSA